MDEIEVLKMLLLWGIPPFYGAEASASESLSYNIEVRSGFLRQAESGKECSPTVDVLKAQSYPRLYSSCPALLGWDGYTAVSG